MTRRSLLASLGALALNAAPVRKTKNIVLFTSDGVRWQDVFGGMDPRLMNEKSAGMQEQGAAKLRETLWKETPEARREALMPTFWKALAPRGVVLGNVNKGSSVRVTNRYSVSYPGYSEILTGRAQDEAIRGNDPIRNPTPTVLEVLREKRGLTRKQVAIFASWGTFHAIGEHTPGSLTINAGYEPFDDPSPRARELSAMQFDARTPWDDSRHDYVTFGLALDYLRREHPRVLEISYDETDDWAHERRYDRVLEMLQFVDRSLLMLWSTLQSIPEYRDQTTLIVTCDHGRGDTLQDFGNHGAKVVGADQIWIAIFGPDTPARGEVENSPDYHQSDIAPTILELMGIPYTSYEGVAGKPIAAALK